LVLLARPKSVAFKIFLSISKELPPLIVKVLDALLDVFRGANSGKNSDPVLRAAGSVRAKVILYRKDHGAMDVRGPPTVIGVIALNIF
jgi:hypothetical protein